MSKNLDHFEEFIFNVKQKVNAKNFSNNLNEISFELKHRSEKNHSMLQYPENKNISLKIKLLLIATSKFGEIIISAQNKLSSKQRTLQLINLSKNIRSIFSLLNIDLNRLKNLISSKDYNTLNIALEYETDKKNEQ